ncbi:hypothetical protein CcrC1_gp397 [Caulobacter phage C1]|nr:hypothetical protein CcrC1_gp397 [Caulobacter phage C1]UTU08626.1 hypothetical protein CcrC2_gp398 [Caulobacter phage C2]UTU09141.1 hypothetical protein CcrJ4_gp392 [Caulobacter phage J4]UTU10258.1 hypothetical protein CcrRB23_gp396 [Caulobacter phage RB23]WGN97292.1 hypothetical protein [Bertelyvirus sp.]
MSKDRDLQGLTNIIEGAMVQHDLDCWNLHISLIPEAFYNSAAEHIQLGSGGRDYDVHLFAEDLYDGLEKFFNARLKARIEAMMDKMVEHEKRYVEHLFGAGGAL